MGHRQDVVYLRRMTTTGLLSPHTLFYCVNSVYVQIPTLSVI